VSAIGIYAHKQYAEDKQASFGTVSSALFPSSLSGLLFMAPPKQVKETQLEYQLAKLTCSG